MKFYLALFWIILFIVNMSAMHKKIVIKKYCKKQENAPDIYCRLLAYYNDKIVGELSYFEPKRGKRAKIGYLSVDKEMRMQGIGKALVTSFIAEAKKKRCPGVDVSAALRAVEFYEKLGFTCEKESFEANDSGWTNIRFCHRAIARCPYLDFWGFYE